MVAKAFGQVFYLLHMFGGKRKEPSVVAYPIAEIKDEFLQRANGSRRGVANEAGPVLEGFLRQEGPQELLL